MEPNQNHTSNNNGSGTQVPEAKDTLNFKSWKLYLKDKIMGNNCPVASVPADAYEYDMNHAKRGKALIFNHKSFAPSLGLSQRSGTDVDRDNLEIIFKCLGYEACVFNDLTSKQVNNTLREVALQDHSNCDTITIAVLSHGTKDKIYAYDESYDPNTLTQYFQADYCKTLAGKPKWFIVLACRGEDFDDGTSLQIKRRRYANDGDSDKGTGFYKIPNQADFLMVYSTFPGHYSWRNSKTGSAFIKALCTVIATCHREVDVLTMMTNVNREVAINFESNVPKDVTQNSKKQMPQVCHTLLRQIYFNKKPTEQGTLKQIKGTLV